ncbi:transglutaminase-like cysteine peptidase [Pararhizobium haloflavum]|uniref:transglutaminase-like cysteine peptidase n=1 Tax=Pararhizobium haloflavum TaxID=2037914 RepID=UPI000C18C0F2|nr:transglutaminase-like cysteine peptidase [Pararhizobium haloflavum]
MAAVALFWTPPADAVEPDHRSMMVGAVTSQPIGHYEFCKRNVSECNLRAQPTAAPRVTDFGWEVVREVNLSVNDAIVPRTDEDMHGIEELWSYPELEGDCEDYVLLKRLMLMERGFSANDLLITVVRKRDGEGHAVLTLRTSEGDFILDNLDREVRLWTETPYVFLKRQASFHSGRWVSIEYGSDVPVGALQ